MPQFTPKSFTELSLPTAQYDGCEGSLNRRYRDDIASELLLIDHLSQPKCLTRASLPTRIITGGALFRK